MKSPVGSVENAGSVGKKRERSVGGVVFARGITQKTPRAGGRIFVCRVCKERPGAQGGIEVPSVLLRSENKPTAVLYVPALRLKSAF